MRRARRARTVETVEGAGLRPAVALTKARSFLSAIAELPGRSFKSPGRGWDVRYAGGGVSGSALAVGGVAVHGAFFAAEVGRGGGGLVNADAQAEQRMVGFDRRRGYLEGRF